MQCNYLKKDLWSPYVVGFFLALLAIASFLFFGKMLGASTFFVKIAAAIWYLIYPEHLEANSYYAQLLKSGAYLNFYVALAFGIFLGSFLAGKLSGQRPSIPVPSVWKARFGDSRKKRNAFAFLGGVLVMIGARLAGGCTSGLGISGGMQLSVPAFLFMAGLFGVGVPAAILIYKRGKHDSF